jgi:hypothetical protein
MDNHAEVSGGAAIGSGSAIIRDCRFEGNTATYLGGGGLFLVSSLTVANCLFQDCAGNKGGGVLIRRFATPTLVNCTFCGNTANIGSGVWLEDDTSVTVVNTIIAHGILSEAVAGEGIKELYHCNLFGNEGGDWVGDIADQLGIHGNISEDPHFVNWQTGDCHIQYDSPCRDSGDNGAPNLPEKDFEGDPRITYGTVDMGADEFYTHLYHTGDATPGGTVDFKVTGLPGSNPVQLWLGSEILDPPMHTKYGDWYLEFPLLAHLMMGSIPSPQGVLILTFTFPPDTPAPLFLPLQAGVRMELTNLSVMAIE